MKLKMILFCLAIALVSCEEETLAPTVPIDEMPQPEAEVKKAGAFMNGPYGSVSGTANVFMNVDGTYEIQLAEFNTNNGPDLYVYLSKEIMPVNFISLGKLKSTKGNQVYSIPGTPNFAEYKYVAIHCRQYNHLFGYALVE